MEKCPDCGKPFESTQALGSHRHYVHNQGLKPVEVKVLCPKCGYKVKLGIVVTK